MSSELGTFESPVASRAGLIVERQAQAPLSHGELAAFQVISADNHIEIIEDIFYERFPASLKEAAPRVWFDRYWRLGYRDAMQAYPPGVDIDTALERSVLNAGFDFNVRFGHLDTEGITQEIVYPQSLLAFIRHPDQALQELMYRTYNDYMAELGARSGGRFHGVGICSNWWDPARVESSVQQVVDLGLKGILLPFSPGKGADGQPVDYAGEASERLWSVLEAAGLPVSFHIGEVPAPHMRGGFGTFFIIQATPFRRVLGNLIFGGILDRHPRLRIVFAEGGINWVAGALQDCELTYGAHLELYDWKPKHRPSWYWHNHCYATFQTDAIGLKLIDVIGADRVMWAQDYPHSEGTFGYTADAVAEVTNAVAMEDARKILGETARSLYRLPELRSVANA